MDEDDRHPACAAIVDMQLRNRSFDVLEWHGHPREMELANWRGTSSNGKVPVAANSAVSYSGTRHHRTDQRRLRAYGRASARQLGRRESVDVAEQAGAPGRAPHCPTKNVATSAARATACRTTL